MKTVHTVAELRAAVAAWRKAGQRVGFVPTMGNLHAGHVALVARARELTDKVVASVFVNPLQFAPDEDFETYPRTLDADAAKLTLAGCDLLFAPSVPEMYPSGRDHHASVTVPDISDILCGAHRPGHFTGVATVVAKLFGQVQPDVAVFGEKDYQQLKVIERMVRDFALPVRVVGLPTVREDDGLALSSRNQYLSPEERAIAPQLHATLTWAAEQFRQGRPHAEVEGAAAERLRDAGFKPDYVSLRSADDLGPPVEGAPRRVLAAAWLGAARLIDNVPV
jgi:pantoate--beta-alanine ligase